MYFSLYGGLVFPPYLGLQLTPSFWFERCPPHVKINMENPRRYLTGGKPHIHKPQLVLLSNGISILFGVARHESARAPMYIRFPWVHGSYVTFEFASLIGQCISHAFPSCLFHAHFFGRRAGIQKKQLKKTLTRMCWTKLVYSLHLGFKNRGMFRHCWPMSAYVTDGFQTCQKWIIEDPRIRILVLRCLTWYLGTLEICMHQILYPLVMSK